MGKASTSGRAKTRLVPPLSAEEAAHFNTAFLQDIADNLLKARGGADIAPYIAYAPAGSEQFFRQHLPPGIGLLETCGPDFGECLHSVIERLLGLGHASVCVLNSDSPTLPTRYLVEAAHALGLPGDRAVLGPSMDGGYYLLGLKRPHGRLFERIDWSSGRVAEQTRERAREIGLPLTLLDSWYDVDDAATLQTLNQELTGQQPFRRSVTSFDAPHTRALLEQRPMAAAS